jgi:hypothetical protein
MSPSWLQIDIPYEGSLKEILGEVVVIRLKHYFNMAEVPDDELLGECTV